MISNIQVHEHLFGVGGTNTPKVIGVLAARWMPGLFPEQDAQQKGR
jgi:hypothetical protein